MSLITKILNYLSLNDENIDRKDIEYITEFNQLPNGKGITTIGNKQREMLVQGDDGEIYMGEYPRKIVESSGPDDPVYIGYQDDPVGAAEEYGIPIDEDFYKHLSVLGTTGSGKSTLLKNIMIQLIYGGHGITYIDPKGEDCLELLQHIPEHRIEDVVYITAEQPSTENKTIGFNYLQLPVDEDHPEYKAYVKAQVDFVSDALNVKGGSRMHSIVKNFSRVMIRSEINYTLYDLYNILNNEDKLEKFYQQAVNEVGQMQANFVEQVKNLDDNDLEPVVRRLEDLALDPIKSEVVAHPDTTITLEEIVDEKKIVILDAESGDPDITRFYATHIVNQIWQAIQKLNQGNDKTPHFIFYDEFATLFTDKDSGAGKVPEITSQARSFKLSFTLATQTTEQIPDSVLKEIFENINTNIALNIGGETASDIQNYFSDFGNDRKSIKSKLTDTQDYKSINSIESDDGKSTFRIDNFPDYPPLRTLEECKKIKKDSLDRYGEERLTEEDREDNLKFEGDTDSETISQDNGVSNTIESVINSTYYTLLHSADSSSRDELKNTYVSIDTVREVVQELYDSSRDYEFAALIEENSTYFEQKRSSEGMKISLTSEGLGIARETSSGEGGSGGKGTHRTLLKETRDFLGQQGIAMTVPSQGGESLPDGVGYPLPLDTPDNFSTPYINQILETLDDDKFVVEAESKTISKPYQSLTNLAKAYTENDYCLFVVENEDNARKLENIFKTPGGIAKQYDDGARKFYNTNDNMKTELQSKNTGFPLRPNTKSSIWVEKDNTYYLLSSKSSPLDYDNAIAKFDTLSDLNSYDINDFTYHYVYTNQNKYQVYKNGQKHKQYETREELQEDWSTIKRPFIPKNKFGTSEIPDNNHYSILVIPPDDADEEISIYEDRNIYQFNTTDSKQKVDTEDTVDEAITKGVQENEGEPPTVTDNRTPTDDAETDTEPNEETETEDNTKEDNPFL